MRSKSKSEKEKMLAGELYNGMDPELIRLRSAARVLLQKYNQSSPDSGPLRASLLKQLFKKCGKNVWIEPPFFCDYGAHTSLGDGAYLNCNCVILDCHTVEIGAGTLIGPGVQIYTAYHPTNPILRKTGLEQAAPIKLGTNVWIGGGAILCPGVTVGNDTTIGAGSVVTKSVPAGVIAAGNPCRIIRPANK